jgi:hypothetical protein
MISSSHGKPAVALTPGRPKILGRPGDGRCWEPSNVLAMSLDCQARIVSGVTRLAISSSARGQQSVLPNRPRDTALSLLFPVVTRDGKTNALGRSLKGLAALNRLEAV